MIQSTKFWQIPLEKKLQTLNSKATGLSHGQAQERLKDSGANVLKTSYKKVWRQILDRFMNPLVVILLVASGISALTGETTGFYLITLIVLMSIALDFFQQYRSELATEKLKSSVALQANVWREGMLVEVPFTDLVPGDVVQLSAGDLIPADGLVFEEKDLFVNQALLTGESFPVEKKSTHQTSSVDLNDALNALFSGTSVLSGTCKLLICCTGAKTVIGEMSESLTQEPPPTAFDLGMKNFGALIMRLTIILVLFVMMINAFHHRPFLESFMFAIALAVGLTPELLPMIVTVTLSRGAIFMAKKSVIIKRLRSIQNLGSMDVLCSDKTGTLTEGKIVLEKHVNLEGQENFEVLEMAFLNSHFETGYRSPIDQAILEHSEIVVDGWQKVDEVPFDFERRRVSVLLDNGAKRILVVKGATEEILSLCNQFGVPSMHASQSLSPQNLERANEVRCELENEGFRNIGVAWKEVPRDCVHAHTSDEMDLIFAGMAAFHDPPKKDIKFVLKSLQEIQVSIRVVTGDSELVARHLFKMIDLPITGVLSGSQIETLDDLALQAQIDEVNLFCRVSPMQKKRIMMAFKKRGHVVGYMGDGVNDAPSLHAADVGISVEGAVDVAKAAADIVLLKNDLKILLAGILEGRRTHLNIMKYIMMATSSNFGNMFSMAGATLMLPFLPMLPLQVLLNNFLYDLSEIAIPIDRVDHKSLCQPTKWNVHFVHRFMWVIGLLSSAFDFLTFYLLIHLFHAQESMFHTGWFVESMATQVLVIFIIRTQWRPWQSRPSTALVFSSLAIVTVACLIPLFPWARELGFVPLTLKFYLLLIGIVASYLVLVETVKQWFYRSLSEWHLSG